MGNLFCVNTYIFSLKVVKLVGFFMPLLGMSTNSPNERIMGSLYGVYKDAVEGFCCF